jgi:hypothetical protein
MRVFIGLDVSLAKTAICVVARDGEVLWQGVPSEPEPLVKRRTERSGAIDLAGIEACPLSEWLHRGLGQGEGDRGLADAAGPDNAQQSVPL